MADDFDPASLGAVAVEEPPKQDSFDPASLGAVPVGQQQGASKPMNPPSPTVMGEIGAGNYGHAAKLLLNKSGLTDGLPPGMEVLTEPVVQFQRPNIGPQPDPLRQIGAGLLNLPADALNFAASPAGVATLGAVPALPGSLQRAVSALFGVQGAVSASQAPNLQEAVPGLAMSALGAAGAATLHGGVPSGARPTLTEKLAPILGEAPKLRDEIYYHASPSGNVKFENLAPSSERPLFMSMDANGAGYTRGNDGSIIPLNIRGKMATGDDISRIANKTGLSEDSLIQQDRDTYKFINALKAEGFDGAYHFDQHHETGDVIPSAVVWNKSAIGDPEATPAASDNPVVQQANEALAKAEETAQPEPVATQTPSEATPVTEAEQQAAPVEQAGAVSAKPKTFRGPADAFGSDITPVAQFLANGDGVLSKSQAIKQGKFSASDGQWDGAADLLSHPTHNKIYKASGESPADAAQAAYDAGLINDSSPDTLWNAIGRESQNARTIAREERTFSRGEKEAHADWQDQLKDGENDPYVQLRGPDGEPALITKGPDGKSIELSLLNDNGEPVASLPHDTLDEALKSAHEQGYLLDDGTEKGKTIFDESPSRQGAKDGASPQETNASVQASTGAEPSGVRESGGLGSGGIGRESEPGSSGSGSGTELVASDTKTPEQLASEKESAKANLQKLQDQQDVRVGAAKPLVAGEDIRPERDMFGADKTEGDDLFDKPEAVKNGVVPAEKVVQGSANPEVAREISPQALGVTHPLPGFIKDIANYFTENKPSQIWNTIKGSLDASLGKTFAKTTIADRTSGEAGARWISAKIAAPHLADTFATQVLDGTGIDPVKFGAALTEDNLRSIRKGAETPEAADKVTTIIGSKGSPFKTEAEYQKFLNDPATQQALERHRALWAETIDPMFRKAQMLEPDEPLPTRGDQTEARINLFNDTEGTGKDVVGGTGKGNLTATFRKKSPFAITAKGTGQSYNINYADQMANTFGRQLEIAAKNDFETKLVDSGNAIIGKPGEAPTLEDGEKTVAFPLKRTTLVKAEDGSKIPVNQNIYVRKSLATEYRNAANVDRYDVPALVKGFANLANKSALAGLTDASVHGLNLMTALFTRPSVAGSVLSDSLLSTFGRADVPVTLAKVITKAFQDTKGQVAELAEIGAMKSHVPTSNPLGKFIQIADKSTRLVLDDTFKKLSDSGLVENTETNRREFVNQVGQYNLKAQGGLRRIFRETGVGPFATAGTTFNTLGLRTATLSPGVEAASPMAAGALRANVLSKWVGAATLVGTLNYLITKNKGGGVTGRPGVPIGSVDTGWDDKNGRPLSFSVFNLLGLGRALRVTGIRGAMESQRKGLNLSTALDGSFRDITNSAISPFAGPIARFGTEATTGYQPAINVPRATHVAPPGENQFAQNLHDSIIDANPVLKSFALAREPGGTVADSIRQQIPRISLQPTQRPEFIEKYPEIVHKAQASAFMDDVVRRARNMQPEARTKFVNDSLSKLTDEDRSHAEKTLRYRKIDY